MDCKATVKIGNFSRGGKTRGDSDACDHDFCCAEKYIPCGIVNENSGELHISFGSSHKTGDFIADTLIKYWNNLNIDEQNSTDLIQIKVDSGPESSGVRTQFLSRMVSFAIKTDKYLQLLYYPPYHSKYNPIERCWGIPEKHWNGTKLTDAETMLKWAGSMTWKGIHPFVKINKKRYEKGISLTKAAMRSSEKFLVRNPILPKWDILISPYEVV
jgi:hypothetical protein